MRIRQLDHGAPRRSDARPAPRVRNQGSQGRVEGALRKGPPSACRPRTTGRRGPEPPASGRGSAGRRTRRPGRAGIAPSARTVPERSERAVVPPRPRRPPGQGRTATRGKASAREEPAPDATASETPVEAAPEGAPGRRRSRPDRPSPNRRKPGPVAAEPASRSDDVLLLPLPRPPSVRGARPRPIRNARGRAWSADRAGDCARPSGGGPWSAGRGARTDQSPIARAGACPRSRARGRTQPAASGAPIRCGARSGVGAPSATPAAATTPAAAATEIGRGRDGARRRARAGPRSRADRHAPPPAEGRTRRAKPNRPRNRSPARNPSPVPRGKPGLDNKPRPPPTFAAAQAAAPAPAQARGRAGRSAAPRMTAADPGRAGRRSRSRKPSRTARRVPAAKPPRPRLPILSKRGPLGAVTLEIGLKSLGPMNRFTNRLDPAELGRIDGRRDRGREVNAKLQVEGSSADAAQPTQDAERPRAGGLRTNEGSVQFGARAPAPAGGRSGRTPAAARPRRGPSRGRRDTAPGGPRRRMQPHRSRPGPAAHPRRRFVGATFGSEEGGAMAAASRRHSRRAFRRDETEARGPNRQNTPDKFDQFLTLLTTQLQKPEPLDPLDTNAVHPTAGAFRRPSSSQIQDQRHAGLTARLQLGRRERLERRRASIGSRIEGLGSPSAARERGRRSGRSPAPRAASPAAIQIRDENRRGGREPRSRRSSGEQSVT